MAAGVKHDDGKLRWDLLPIYPQEETIRVLMHGAAKYGDRNWERGIEWSRVYAAAQRHLTAFWSGKDLDEESRLKHLAHARCCIDFLIEFTETHPELDDRPKSPTQG